MNGYLENQTSGNDWGAPNRAMLHEIRQYLPMRTIVSASQAVFNNLEAQMAQFEADKQSTIGDLRRLYVLPSDSVVMEFLNDHLTIPQLLIHAAPMLKQYFGDTTVFSLRAVMDEYGWQTLYAVVIWPGAVRDASVALDKFLDEWWIANSKAAYGRLTFTYELV